MKSRAYTHYVYCVCSALSVLTYATPSRRHTEEEGTCVGKGGRMVAGGRENVNVLSAFQQSWQKISRGPIFYFNVADFIFNCFQY